MNYSLERLTATKPDWGFAFIFIRGMNDPLGFEPNMFRVRWIRDQNIIVINIPRVPDPSNPPTEGGMGPNGSIPATPGGLAELEAHVHIDEIIAINFYNPWTKEQYDNLNKEREKLHKKNSIVNADGEDPEIEAKREELHNKKDDKKNKLKKAD